MNLLTNATRWVAGAAIALATFAAMAQAQGAATQGAVPAELTAWIPPGQIFTLLFLMLGPFKIIGPFAQVTHGADARLTRRIATLSIAFASAALLIAALLGKSILDSYGIPVPVMALTGGLILAVVALKNLIGQFVLDEPVGVHRSAPPEIKDALRPIAFPTIVTPYGIAAVVVMMAVSPNADAQIMVGGIVVAIMVANLAIMLVVHRILPVMGIVLPILGSVLGVVQVALGLQIIRNALGTLGVL